MTVDPENDWITLLKDNARTGGYGAPALPSPKKAKWQMRVGGPIRTMNVESNAAVHYGLAHLRLVHVNKRDLKSIVQQGRMKDINIADLKHDLFCTGCAVGKATNLPYIHPPRQKVTELGGRVHMDIWGPSRVTGIGGERYMLSCIDEASSNVDISLLKTKDQAVFEIMAYKIRMEKQYPNFVLKILRSDRAKEILDNNRIRTWMAENGIVSEMSPAYTPQLNSKPERLWCTILEPVEVSCFGSPPIFIMATTCESCCPHQEPLTLSGHWREDPL